MQFLQQSNVCNSIQSDLDIQYMDILTVSEMMGERDCLWYISSDQLCYIPYFPVFHLESPPRVLIGLPSPEAIHFVLFLRWRKRHINQTIHQQQQEINHSLIPQDSASFTFLSFLFFYPFKRVFFLESMHLFNQAKCINSIDKEKHLLYRIEVLWWLMWQF